MLLWRNIAKFPLIIPVTPSYLEPCVNVDALFFQRCVPAWPMQGMLSDNV